MFKKSLYVTLWAAIVAVAGYGTLRYRIAVGPVLLALALVPIAGLLAARRRLSHAIPDFVFGALDTGLLTIPALWGAALFGVAGAIAGGIIGDALTDAIAGFFEGGIAEWLRDKGIEESREPVTTALGKMCGCLGGSGLVLTLALAIGIQPHFL